MGSYLNIEYENNGYGITLPLSQFNEAEKYQNYAVACQYRYVRDKEKYLVQMWLCRKDLDSRFKLDHQDIDTQYLSGTRDTIRPNLCRVVEQGMRSGFFDSYIDNFEFICACFDRGLEIMESESAKGQANV